METAVKHRPKRSGPLHPGALLILLISWIAFGLRVVQLDFQPLWWDEGYSVWFATHPLADLLALTAQDIHPPLYYLLLRGVTLVLGPEPAALRLLSVAAGTLTVPLLYVTGRRVLRAHSAALLAAFLVAVNPLAIYYSQEIRMYGLVALLGTGLLLTAHRLLETLAHGGRRAWLPAGLYVLLTSALLYTQYYAAFLPAGLTLYALWRWRTDRHLQARWLGLQALAAATFVPWLLYAAPRLVPYVNQKVVQDADRPLGLAVYLARHLSTYIAGHLEGNLVSGWPLALVLLMPALVGLGFVVAEWRKPAQRPATSRYAGDLGICATLVAVVLGLGFAISQFYPFFPQRGERLLLMGLPPFLLLYAAGIAALWQRVRLAGVAAIALAGLAAALSLNAFYTVPRYAGDDYRPLIARAIEQGLPEDRVLCIYPWQVGYWRSYSGWPASGPEAFLAPTPEWGPELAASLDDALQGGHVWFPAHLSLGAITEEQVESYLIEHARPFANQWYGPGTRLSAWAEAPDGAMNPAAAQEIHFTLPDGSRLFLVGVTSAETSIPAANRVASVDLGWRAGTRPVDLVVSLRMIDAAGQIWAQHDYEPLGSLNGLPDGALSGAAEPWQAEDHLGLLIPAGTPPGAYRVTITLRPRNSERRLEAGDAGGTVSTEPTLFALSVGPPDRGLGPKRLPIARRMAADLQDGIRFLGYSTVEAIAAPGELRRVSLFWQAIKRPQADYNVFLQLLDSHGRMVAGAPEAPPGAGYPTSQWQPDTLIHTQTTWRAPANLADGRYQLIAGLFRRGDGLRLRTPQGSDYISLGSVTIRGRAHTMTPPRPAYLADALFSGRVRLIGYDLSPTLERGSLTVGPHYVTLYWHVLEGFDLPYSVFVHLLDASGRDRAYADREPGSGRYPTTGWLPGEYIADRHDLIVSPDLPSGAYSLTVGLYDPISGQRLTLSDGADQVLLNVTLAAP